MFQSIFNSIINRRDVKLFLSFSLLPLVIVFIMPYITLQSTEFTKSFLAFLHATLEAQYTILLPVLVFALVISSVFRDEIDSGILFLYKDISRSKIFHLKILGIMGIYGLYTLLSSGATLIAYYGFLVPKYDYGVALIPSNSASLQFNILGILGIILVNLITIAVVAMVSISSKAITAVLAGIFFNLFIMTAPLWIGLKYLAPIAYLTILAGKGFFPPFLAMTSLSLVYFAYFYSKGIKKFQKIEF
ncbi:amino acid transporter [Streptococcus sp. zg-86]|uniref:Amino acid transporter n=1 Tax=Streptococcus zhangguiae TaxID=2664091 RepID=A0A6I4R8L4_9STRE|nr:MULTISPECIES: amino acid transporter [unclassified Streptococcus]MTB64138.1 amino acid transporter [Streptococcus sp. zg-86]MTB90536.1 amino acid transporter [Streptococcus sp. zg-36]MWV56126.1 amino acid transporter [Streptococcus sp. zg-70]QTH48250.1 amino acid transporter [Streptococcus sp. zg-86]